PNLGSVDEDLVRLVREGLDDPDIFRGKRLNNLKTDAGALQVAIADALEKAKAKARAALTKRAQMIVGMSEYSGAEESLRQQVDEIIRSAQARVDDGIMVSAIQQAVPAFDGSTMPRIVDLLTPEDQPDVKPTIALS